MLRSTLSALALAFVFTIGAGTANAAAVSSVSSGNWSSPSIWSTGTVPGANDGVTIGHTVTYDVTSSRVSGVTINSGATLVFSPSKTVTLQTNKNVINRGLLQMKPSSVSIVHTLHFVDVDESLFIGGGMDPVDTDVGLWTMGSGKLDILGTAKTGWTNLAGSASKGASSITVNSAAGWRVGDTVVIAPNEPVWTQVKNGEIGSWSSFDERTITSISGNTVTLNASLTHAHPAALGPNGKSYTAEVMNITRNVKIMGMSNHSDTPDGNGRAHIFIRSTVPQSIKYLELSHLGPRQYGTKYGTTGVLGRWGLHFHHSFDGSRGSIVEGVAAHHMGNHAYAPHHSSGITFRDTVAYDVWDSPYWWDEKESGADPGELAANESHDILYDHAIAAKVNSMKSRRLSGFDMQSGTGNIVRNSVAVGVKGGPQSGGFVWQECCGSLSFWTFENNIGHNNTHNGAFWWQNCNDANKCGIHLVDDFVAYHNGGEFSGGWGGDGIMPGAYVNAYRINRPVLFGNMTSGIHFDSRARISKSDERRPDGYLAAHEDILSTDPLRLNTREGFKGEESLVLNCNIPAVHIHEDGSHESHFAFVNCMKYGTNQALEPTDFFITNGMHEDTVIRVQRPDGAAFKITGPNATITSIPAFYTVSGDSTPPPSTDPDVTVSFSASPTSVEKGGSSTLTWSSSGATSCSISYTDGDLNDVTLVNNGSTSGSVSVSPSETTTYNLSCSNATKSGTAEATVTVTLPPPTASLSASPTSISSGQSSTLTWSSTNATQCSIDNGVSTGGATSGSVSVTPSNTTTYTVTCIQPGETSGDVTKTAEASATVNVTTSTPAPTLTLSASPTSIASGESSTLTWSSTDATSCSASGAWSGTKAVSGSESVSPTQTSTYILECTGTGGSVTKDVSVTVTGDTPEPAPTGGLIHHYKLDDGSGTTALDSAGSVNGTLQGGLCDLPPGFGHSG